jgi:RNA polymerase sigma factor (sigma-70 family)
MTDQARLVRDATARAAIEQIDLAGLVRSAQAGNRDARERVLGALQPTIVRSVRLIVGAGSAWAEDAAQDALRDVDRGLNNLRDPATIRTWAYRIAVKRAIKVARRERLRHAIGGAAPDSYVPVARDDVSRDARDALRAAFDRLPPRLRAVAVLRLYLDLSEEQTAESLGCSIGTVKSQLHDARHRLTEDLRASGYGPSVLTPSHSN